MLSIKKYKTTHNVLQNHPYFCHKRNLSWENYGIFMACITNLIPHILALTNSLVTNDWRNIKIQSRHTHESKSVVWVLKVWQNVEIWDSRLYFLSGVFFFCASYFEAQWQYEHSKAVIRRKVKSRRHTSIQVTSLSQ